MAKRCTALRKCFYYIAVIVPVAIVVLLLLALIPSAPNGRYVADSGIDAGTDFYWECSSGKLYFVSLSDGLEPAFDEWGKFSEVGDGWLLMNSRHTNLVLNVKSSWAGLSLTYPDGTREFWRRRIIPRRPNWMIDSLPWSIQ